MACKPYLTLPHNVIIPGEDVRLYDQLYRPFAELMASLYPHFASYTAAEKGYSAFAADGRFIGQFAGMTLQSIRRNPFLIDDTQLFMRALLAGLARDGYKHHASVCSPDNYGTLRLWQKLGLGAKLDARGKARSDSLENPGARDTLHRLIAECRDDYPGIRRYAERQLDSAIQRAGRGLIIARFIPTEDTFGGIPTFSATVTLDA